MQEPYAVVPRVRISVGGQNLEVFFRVSLADSSPDEAYFSLRDTAAIKLES